MFVLHQNAGLLRFSSKPILLFVLLAICAACDSAKDFLIKAESLAEKAAYMDSLFAMNREPAEFVKATDNRTIFDGSVSPDLKKAIDLLKKDDADYRPKQVEIFDLSWREVRDSICFYYCNEEEDAVIIADSLGANIYPKEGLKWINNEEAVRSRINNSMFDRTLDPFPVLDKLEKTRYLAFISNDCVIYPYDMSLLNGFNRGSARLTIKLFDLTDRSYMPFETFTVFAKNSRTISVTETTHQFNGMTSFKTTDSSSRILEDLSNNLILEVTWAVYSALVSAKKTMAIHGESQPGNSAAD